MLFVLNTTGSNNYEKAHQLYKEMEFWGVVPLRETFYHFLDVNERIGSDA